MSVAVSVFDIFKVGIGPSSSHTVGPMRAARIFVTDLAQSPVWPEVTRVRAELFGSLGATGHGHGSEAAVLLGLEGEDPATVDTDQTPVRAASIANDGRITLDAVHGGREISFDVTTDLVLHRNRSLPFHPNGMTFTAWSGQEVVVERTFYSIGGGFVVEHGEDEHPAIVRDSAPAPYPFKTGKELLEQCSDYRMSIPEVAMANEMTLRAEEEIRGQLLDIWAVMHACVERGCSRAGVLPGGLHVRRRAMKMHHDLVTRERITPGKPEPFGSVDWLTVWALAVNEENAAGGRIVTAPTNGAAGIIPSCLHFAVKFLSPGSDIDSGTPGVDTGDDDLIVNYLLAAGAVGEIYQQSASISGAEVGCQGEVGVACSMAAAGLAQVMGGTPTQVCNAAEIGLEHHLGLTCDPVGGLVQIPCIERNALGAIKAVTAARLAMAGDGSQIVSLDQVMKTMMETGRDMKVKYKETARGGLAVNIVEC